MPRCSCSCRWWSGVTPWTKAAEASAEPPQRSAAPLYFHTGTEIRSVWDDYSKGRHDFNFYKFLDQTRDSTFGLRQVPSQYQVHFSVLQLFKYINKSNPTKKNLKNSYSGSAVHVYSKPHRFVGGGSGFRPPGFAGEVVRIGRDASFPIFHIAEDLDGVLCAPLVWINPVLACIKRYKQKTTTYVSGSHLEITENNVLIIGEKEEPHRSVSEGSTAWCPGRFLQGSSCCRQDCGGFADVHWGSSVWRGLQCLRAGQPRSYWEELRLCSSLEVEEDQQPFRPRRIPRHPACHHHSCHSRKRERRGLPQLRWGVLEGLEGQVVQVHLEDPDQEKMEIKYFPKLNFCCDRWIILCSHNWHWSRYFLTTCYKIVLTVLFT